MRIKGTFEISMNAEPPFDAVDGVALARATFDKRFAGDLDATSKVHMVSVRTPVETSAAYVAVERVTGTLVGKRGSFVLVHTGVMTAESSSMEVVVAPDSGTGELAGLSGRMTIEIVEGQHWYDFELELAE